MQRNNIGYLVLENKQILTGKSFGYPIDVSGEVVFNTGMVGYPESFTDPSYFGQILTMTYPLIGNYGVPENKIKEKLSTCFESDRIHIRGLIVSSDIEDKTHWNASRTLSQWLIANKIPALSGIDTRTLTENLREKGVMKGAISFSKPDWSKIKLIDINQENLIPYVSCQKKIVYGSGKFKLLVVDTGVKLNQIRILLQNDITVIRVPWNYNPFNSGEMDFNAIFLCNGPGDARTITQTIAMVSEALKREIPTFGICLGNQILALAAGGGIYKLKYGHRGQNQPVKDLLTDKCYVTSQNHGFVVDNKSLPSGWEPWFVNLNDGTNEGIRHNKLPFSSVQFHPESAPGPTDTEWLFNYFIDQAKAWLAKKRKKA